MRRGVIVYNPTSGSRGAQRDLVAARAYLVEHGWSIKVEQTRAAGDAGRLARAAADAGLETVLIAGGDGTLNEAANALVGTQTAIGLLPCGTANVWARQLGMLPPYRGLVDAARLMNEARVRTIDVGRATVGLDSDRSVTRHFLLWSGLGLDAHVTQAVEPRPASFKRWGVIGYSLAAVRAAMAYRGVRAELEIDGRRMAGRVMLAVVGNAGLYAGYFPLAPDAKLDDGWLDVSVFRGYRFLSAVGHFVRMLLRLHLRDPQVITTRARRIRVTTSDACGVHVDAEPIGATPAEFSVVPRALRILAPASAPAGLFASGEEGE
jgi:YegS/Rv2252/BmrU family lipid kinase